MINTTNTNIDFLSEEVVEDGSLNEQGALNVALSFFNVIRDIDEDASELEVVLFKQSLPLAEEFCASLSNWTFLVDSIEYEEEDIENDEPVLVSDYKEVKGKVKGKEFTESGNTYCHVYTLYKTFIYAYKLPSNCLKIKYINGRTNIGYAVKGNILYCNEYCPVVDYQSREIKNIPVSFGYMIAYQCAMNMAQHIDPEGTALGKATNMFQMVYTACKQVDDFNVRTQNPPQNRYIDNINEYIYGVR